MSTTNPDAFGTMVASTAQAFMTQTMEALPTPTATTPAATETPTSTPSVTKTSTNTTDIPTLTKMEDGTTQFLDYQAGVKLTVPSGWLAVRLGQQEYLDAQDSATDNPVLLHSLAAIQDLDPAIYRLHAFNTQEGYTYGGEGSRISVLFIEGDTQELELIAEAEVQPKDFEGYELITSKYQIRTDGLELFTLEENWQVESSTKQQVMVYHKRVVFKVSNGTIYIDLSIPSEIKDNGLLVFQTLIDQLSLFTP